MISLAAVSLSWLWVTLQWASAVLGLLLVAGTLLSMTPISQWWARVWEFPRLQLAVAAPVLAAVYVLASLPGGYSAWVWLLVALLAASCLWQLWRIRPYTVLGPEQVKRSESTNDEAHVLRLVISNVLQTNRDYERWRKVVVPENPDVLAAAEVDQPWVDFIDSVFGQTHPHKISCPLDNLYGLAVWSRLPIADGRVEFIIQDDIPSIHGKFTLEDGEVVTFHCIHPRPPIPPEHGDSKPRDAELVTVARRVAEEREDPDASVLVFGDLNDVAWSRTTDLFIKISRLLDVRRGRGFYNTFDANSRLMRFPLDHIFISPEFRLVKMKVLAHVGSDHFPVSVTLSHEPEGAAEQSAESADAGDREEAGEMVAAAADGV